MFRIIIFTTLITILSGNLLNAQNVTPRQYFFIVKKLFPDTKDINVILDKDNLNDLQDKIAQAAGQAQVSVKVYPVSDSKSIGKSLNKMGDSETLVVIPSSVLNDKSSRLFILKKCKEKNIAVVSESKEYSDSGALLGIFPQNGAKSRIVLNLKHCQDLLGKFTPDYAAQMGISEIKQ